jgi:hypothetical protein
MVKAWKNRTAIGFVHTSFPLGVWLLGTALAPLASLANASSEAQVQPTDSPPRGAQENALELFISDRITSLDLEIIIVPLTQGLGLDTSKLLSRSVCSKFSSSRIRTSPQIIPGANPSNFGPSAADRAFFHN